MPNSRRLFFALNPDPETLQGIQAVQRCIPHPKNARRVPAARLHATLLFLGEKDDAQLDRILGLADRIEPPVCELVLDRIGRFPGGGVVWLGTTDLPAELTDFQSRLAESVRVGGITFDNRPWQMHVTLYRDLRMSSVRIPFKPVRWPVRGFELMESVHSKRGLEYISRGRWAV